MLEFIREKMQGTFATVIVGFFCVAFALWGVERVFESRSRSSAVVKVNGNDITEPELANAVENMRKRYLQMLGGKVDPSFLNDKMLRGPALDSLIARKLLDEKTAAMKMTVGSTTVDRSIVSDPVFSKDGKTFDVDYYKEKLRGAGISIESYRRQMHEQLVHNHLRDGVSSTALVTDKQVAELARLEAQTRSFEYIRFPLQDAMKTANPPDESVAKYYNDHLGEFLTEEKVAIEYLELNKDELLKAAKVEDADIRAAYEKVVAEFKPTTERHAAHILIEQAKDGSEQAVLQTINKRLAAGEDFAALAKEFSKDDGSAAQGGDVGFTTGETFVPEFEAALAALKNPGDISPPVKTVFGYHIIKLLEQRQSSVPSYEDRKDEIAKELRSVKANTEYSEKVDQLSESTYSAGDLSGPSAQLGLTIQKTVAFGRRGGAGIASQPKIIDAAFSPDLVDSGKNSQVIEIGNDKSVVLRVVSHELPKTRDMAEVREQIIEKLKREEATTTLKSRLDGLKGKVVAGYEMAAVAKDEGLQAIKADARKRSASGDEAELVETVFKLPKPLDKAVIADSIQLSNGDWALLHLVSVTDKDPGKDSEEFQAVRKRLDASSSTGDYSVYEQGLRDKAQIIRKDSVADTDESAKGSGN